MKANINHYRKNSTLQANRRRIALAQQRRSDADEAWESADDDDDSADDEWHKLTRWEKLDRLRSEIDTLYSRSARAETQLGRTRKIVMIQGGAIVIIGASLIVWALTFINATSQLP